MDFAQKYEKLKSFIREKGKDGVVIAFSGGVDSSTLAAICHQILGEKAVAVTIVSPLYPQEEIEEAKKVAKEIGIKHILLEENELLNKNDFVKNTENRCYYCKKELIKNLKNLAEKLGFKVIFEGTNYSDLKGHRPGFKAIKEMENVYSPWAENEFTKEEIRAIAKRMGLSVSDKPSLACLASRIPFGEEITLEKLKRIEKAENIIRKLTQAKQIRVRDHNGLARIEVGRDERQIFFNVEIMDIIAKELKELGFKYVTLDLEGYRSGSMLLTLETAHTSQ
jgi:uncharacterized protein